MEDKGGPAVIDMDGVEEVIAQDISGSQAHPRSSTVSDDLIKSLSSSVWQEGRKRAETAIKSYTNIDLLRPYFDVEPSQVLQRVVRSFIPTLPKASSVEDIPSELYGPVMLCFTLVALLLFEMKASSHQVQEGTLMGSALITCFGYWLGLSVLLWMIAYISNTHLRPMQISTLIGYGLTGHCIVVFFSTMVHTTHDHLFFYVMWAICGGLCTLRIISVFSVRTPGPSERIVSAVVIGVLHMGFLLYLHFAYHQIVEDISKALNPDNQPLAKPAAPKPAAPLKG